MSGLSKDPAEIDNMVPIACVGYISQIELDGRGALTAI